MRNQHNEVEYDQEEHEAPPLPVGLLTRSDLLLALARALGTFEPGMQLNIVLPLGNKDDLQERNHRLITFPGCMVTVLSQYLLIAVPLFVIYT